jgi:Uma2 family endonuclease
VIEFNGPWDEPGEMEAKMRQWIANGIEVGWLIDPIEKAVIIYRPGDQPEHLAHPTSVQGTGPIAGFELVTSRIWE